MVKIMNIYSSPTYKQDLATALNSIVNFSNLKNSSILLTGADGTIASFIVDMLFYANDTLDANINVYVAGRNKERIYNRFSTFCDRDNFHFLQYDLFKPIEFNIDIDYIIHAAGNAYPKAFNGDQVGTIIGNVNGTNNLLQYALAHKTKTFLYISSGEVYGQVTGDVLRYDESYSGYVDPLSPRSCYPASKRVTETLCASYSYQYGLKTIIVRPSHTYGPTAKPEDDRAHAQFINCGLSGDNIVLKSKGTQIRSYTYIADCASGIITSLLNGQTGQAYNIANPDSTVSIYEFAQIVSSLTDIDVNFDISVNKNEDTPITRQVLSTDSLEALGWKGSYLATDGIKNTLKVLKEIRE